MNPDLQALAQRLDADPKDALAVQALADYLEERGADPAAVRAITVDGPTVLVFGHPEGTTSAQAHRLGEIAEQVIKFLGDAAGVPVSFVIMPSSVTIRAIKAQVKDQP